MTRHLIMFSGILGSGKTKALECISSNKNNILIISPNQHIASMAKRSNKTFLECYSENLQSYTNIMIDKILSDDSDIVIWNQENLTIDTRKLKISALGVDFKFYSIYFKTPTYESAKENFKSLYNEDYDVEKYNLFKHLYQKPDFFEGFDKIEEFKEKEFVRNNLFIHNGTDTE